jgi:tristetraprolin
MCKSFVELGTCKFGDRCQFAHAKEELRNVPRPEKYKTRKCKKFFEEGICPYGSRCSFLHSDKPLVELGNSSDEEKPWTRNVFDSPVSQQGEKKIFKYKYDSDDLQSEISLDSFSSDDYLDNTETFSNPLNFSFSSQLQLTLKSPLDSPISYHSPYSLFNSGIF